ncbi:AAA family ATPase [Bradyrhizobium sp. CCBAU 11434]|uniref:AAA family ATPase n=1 Tax=Bradyrhizobium sp. CCBAU 11434 TaxID=1630885 RepID=UPI002305ED19|nr:AAA family ATPase [Bradyrhizobium sp. CCBAU 11434]
MADYEVKDDFPGDAGDSGPIRNAAKLRTKVFEPIRYVVPGYVADGCTILAGRPKIGKSWLMLDIALAVADDGYCLGEIKCAQGDVLYLALEDNERRLHSRITKLIGDSSEWPAAFDYATEWPRADEGGIDNITGWIAKARKPRLIVVDVLARFRSPRRKDQQPYESDYAAIQGLQTIASKSGIAIVIVHHLRKSMGDSDPFEKVSGTMGLSGAADTTLVLDRDASGVTLYGRGRDIEEIESAVEFSKLTGKWRVLGPAAEVHRSGERSTILQFLIDAGEPVRIQDIVAGTGMPRNNVDQLLFKMGRDGEVIKAGRGLYTCPQRPQQYPPHKSDKKIRREDGTLDFNFAARQWWN